MYRNRQFAGVKANHIGTCDHGQLISAWAAVAVRKVFGAGNISTPYHDSIRRATKLHKPIVVLTQCLKGAAEMGIYEVGAIPLQLGAISGGDMTMPTATQKLMYALGKAKINTISPKERIEFVRELLQTEFAREITVQSEQTRLSL